MILVRLAVCLFALALLGFAVSISSAESGQDHSDQEAVLIQR
jgi:hypothetical protein